jgi:hypothetical protein
MFSILVASLLRRSLLSVRATPVGPKPRFPSEKKSCSYQSLSSHLSHFLFLGPSRPLSPGHAPAALPRFPRARGMAGFAGAAAHLGYSARLPMQSRRPKASTCRYKYCEAHGGSAWRLRDLIQLTQGSGRCSLSPGPALGTHGRLVPRCAS